MIYLLRRWICSRKALHRRNSITELDRRSVAELETQNAPQP